MAALPRRRRRLPGDRSVAGVDHDLLDHRTRRDLPMALRAARIAPDHWAALWSGTNATGTSPTWTNIAGNLPPFDPSRHVTGEPWISGIAFSAGNTAEAWVTIGGLGVGHVWHTLTAGSPAGTVWVDIS